MRYTKAVISYLVSSPCTSVLCSIVVLLMLQILQPHVHLIGMGVESVVPDLS